MIDAATYDKIETLKNGPSAIKWKLAKVGSHDAAAKAVALCRSGETEALMKGSLHTDELMSAVVPSATGLRTKLRVSHVFVMDVPTYPRQLFINDAAINIYPALEDKVDILKNKATGRFCIEFYR
jgi:phosphate acetyltransferase